MIDNNSGFEMDLHTLLHLDDPQLLKELGERASLIERNILRSGPRLMDPVDYDETSALGLTDDTTSLGKRVLRRWNASAHELICGTAPADAEVRNKFKTALGLGDVATAGILTTGLISLGLPTELAPILAAIIVRSAFSPAYEECCTFWKQKLSDTSTA